MSGLPGLSHIDHVGLTVPDLDAAAQFYCGVIGGVELYRLGPFGPDTHPPLPDGRDWSDAHLNVPGSIRTIAMLKLGANMMLELFQYDAPPDRRTTPPRNCDYGGHHIAFKVDDLAAAKAYLAANGCKVMAGPIEIDRGPCTGLKVNYVLDPWDNQLELVEYGRLPFEADARAPLYRP